MTFDNDEEERKYATKAVFVNIQDRGFQSPYVVALIR